MTVCSCVGVHDYVPAFVLSLVMDVSPEGDLSVVVSSHMVTSSSWEASVDVEAKGELPRLPHDMCRQISSELQRKFQVQ